MKLHLRAMGCHIPYGITQCYLPPGTSEHTHLNPSHRPTLDLPTPEGWKAELTWVTGYIPRWFAYQQLVIHLSTKLAVHSRESNSRHVDHKSDTLTTTLLSHVLSCKMYSDWKAVISSGRGFQVFGPATGKAMLHHFSNEYDL